MSVQLFGRVNLCISSSPPCEQRRATLPFRLPCGMLQRPGCCRATVACKDIAKLTANSYHLGVAWFEAPLHPFDPAIRDDRAAWPRCIPITRLNIKLFDRRSLRHWYLGHPEQKRSARAKRKMQLSRGDRQSKGWPKKAGGSETIGRAITANVVYSR